MRICRGARRACWKTSRSRRRSSKVCRVALREKGELCNYVCTNPRRLTRVALEKGNRQQVKAQQPPLTREHHVASRDQTGRELKLQRQSSNCPEENCEARHPQACRLEHVLTALKLCTHGGSAQEVLGKRPVTQVYPSCHRQLKEPEKTTGRPGGRTPRKGVQRLVAQKLSAGLKVVLRTLWKHGGTSEKAVKDVPPLQHILVLLQSVSNINITSRVMSINRVPDDILTRLAWWKVVGSLPTKHLLHKEKMQSISGSSYNNDKNAEKKANKDRQLTCNKRDML
ncbi:hypothetical protein M5K25_019626 [Dendrobium thyrsiflorum]|uniref:Uncharacterized protein n=1 Tax=Dendrobium thyrsiflorum TaxID=117978 RepID=A0ABD0UMB0_DENTH